MNNFLKQEVKENPYDTYTSTALYKAIYPLIICMKLVGLYHSKEYNWFAENLPNKAVRRKIYPTQIYSAVLVSIITFNALRSLYTFSENSTFGPVVFGKLIVISWYFMCAANGISCFRACHNYKCLPQFFIEWEKIHKEDSNRYYPNFCRTKTYLYVVYCILFIAFNIAGSVYSLFFTRNMESAVTPFNHDSPHVYIIFGFYLVIHVYLTTFWIFPVALQYIICKIIYIEFRRHNKHIEDAMNKCGEKCIINFESLRKRHQNICRLVGHADGFLAFYSGFVLIVSIVGLSVSLYNIIWYIQIHADAINMVLLLFWSVSGVINLAIVCVGGALINQEAHAAVEYMYELPADHVRTENALQINLFLSRLTGNRIGLTAFKLFVFDKPTILTIIGLFITYFIVIVQFSPGFTSTQSSCNCTELLNNATLKCVIA